MLSSDQCGSTYDDRDRDRDRYPEDRCAIDAQVVRSASKRCDEQYNGARPTPLFNERGRPVCCGPVKNYDSNGRVVESCPPSRNSDRDDGGRYNDREQDDDMGAQNMGARSGGDGGGNQRINMT